MSYDLLFATFACGVTLALAGWTVSVSKSSLSSVRARVAIQTRQYVRSVIGALVASLALVLMGETFHVEPLARQFVAIVVAALLALISWQTWQTRRDDPLLVMAVTVAGFLSLLTLTGALTSEAISLWLTVPTWGMLLLVALLVLRRPLPTVRVQQGIVLDSLPQAQAGWRTTINDYVSLTKPKVISLLLVTTLAAMFITPEGTPSLALVFWTMLGGYLAAGGAGAINCAFDGDIDNVMGRTSRRPVPSGRLTRRQALVFGIALNVLAFAVLAIFATPMAAVLALLGTLYYSWFYTCVLKRTTWQNIVIGGGAGAIPPLVGWTAVTGTLSLPAIYLFIIIFYWTPPHFWALALIKRNDYARAGVPMLPVVAGEHETRWQIWLYSLLMFVFSLMLTPLQVMGLVYLGLALVLGIIFLRYAWQVWRDGSQGPTWGLYKYSLLYLALLFAAMVLDRIVLT